MSHVDDEGKARMVDVSGKAPVLRKARARGRVNLSPDTIELIRKNQIAKGDVLSVARIAGITGAKRTWELIPLCHQINIDQVTVDLEVIDDAVLIETHAICTDRTGIEMEALTAVSVAALAIYDMCKAVDGSITITDIGLIEKTKGE